jgi:EamA domain-containing membrane protein RarD
MTKKTLGLAGLLFVSTVWGLQEVYRKLFGNYPLLSFIQYMAPIPKKKFYFERSSGVFIFREPFSQGHALSFGLIWAAISIVLGSMMYRNRRPGFYR